MEKIIMKLFILKLYSKITKNNVYFVSNDKTYYIQPNGSIIIGIKSKIPVRGDRHKFIE